MERSEIREENAQVINITTEPSPNPVFQHPSSPPNATNARNTKITINPCYMFTFLFLTTIIQIIAAIVVLSESTHERPRPPLFTWIICYACGCIATLLPLYWRFHYRYHPATMPARFQVFETVLTCFFIVWFIFGSVCVFARGSFSDAPNLYSLLLAFEFCISLRAFGIPLCLHCINNRGNIRGPHENTTEGGIK